MIQITVNSRVSTECYRLNKDTGNCKNRCSFFMFGDDWWNRRVYGTVKSRAGKGKWFGEWNVDKTNTELSTGYLCKEDDLLPLQGPHILL